MNAHPEEYEPVFLFRMVGVCYQPAELVGEGSLGLVERDVMLFAVGGILAGIPVKGKMAHALHCSYSVWIVNDGIPRKRP